MDKTIRMDKALPLPVVLPLLAVYILLAALGLHYHELWLDESQHFLIGRDSDSLGALYWNMRYDGHPRLWNFMIFFVTHFITRSYVGMQVMHLIISALSALLLLRYAPFSLWVKVLILSGYYFLFEFSVLSRNYALGVLLLFAVCVLLRESHRRLVLIGVLLILLCNAHLFFAFAAMGVFVYLVMEYRGEWFSWRMGVFTLLFVAGLVSVIIQTRTPPEESFHHVYPGEWFSGKNISFAALAVVRGWLPVPRVRELMEGHFWNSYFFSPQHVPPFFQLLLLGALLLLPGMVLRRDRKAMVFYYFSFFWIWAFFIVTQQTATRYFGMVYIYFLAAWWIGGGGMDGVSLPVRLSLYGILAIQVGVGLVAYEQDIVRPFSSSKDVADFLFERGLDKQTVLVDGYNGVPMVSAYLGRPLYCTTADLSGSYVVWKTRYWPRPRPTIGEEIARSSYLQGLGRYVLVSNLRLDTGRIVVGKKSWTLACLASFTNSVVKEHYFIYQSQENQ